MKRFLRYFLLLTIFSCARSNNKIEALCGDGVFDSDSEECDGDDFGSLNCIELGYYGGNIGCSQTCKLDLSGCDVTGRCGDGILHTMYGEQCDTEELNNASCDSLGLGSGILGCDSECHFDVSDCELQPTCGDGIVNGNEDCESGQLGTTTCESLGYYGGNIECSSQCMFDITDCTSHGLCGDGITQSDFEECDGTVTSVTCDDITGFYTGSLVCTAACTLDTAGCGYCGDNIIQASHEECDGSSLGGGCQISGFWYGTTSCNNDCTNNTTNCDNDRLLGSTGDDTVVEIRTGPSDELVAVGYTTGSFDGHTIAGGISDGFIIKYNSDGTKAWSTQFGTSGEDTAQGVAIDSSGNIYITGKTTGTSFYGTFTSGGSDAFISKYNASGTRLWTKIIGSTGDDTAYGIDTDSSGYIYMAGYCAGALPGKTFYGQFDFFVAKYSSSGVKSWITQWGDTSSDLLIGLRVHNGNIFVTGTTSGSIGGINQGAKDNILVKLNSSGVVSWTTLWGTSESDESHRLDIDSSGNIYVVGQSAGAFEGVNQGAVDFNLSKFNTSGTRLWTKQLGTSGNDIGWDVAVSASGDIYTTGVAGGNFDGQTSLGGDDTFITKYSSAGNKQWTRLLGTSATDYGVSMDFDSSGRLFLTGWTTGNFEGKISGGGFDSFITIISPL